MFTLKHQKPFKIIAVSSKYVTLTTSSGLDRPIASWKFEKAWTHLENNGLLSRSEIQQFKISNFHSSYIVAILANMTGVSAKTDPISLKFDKH